MKNKRTCDYIAEAIQNEILSGRMEAGQPLRQEELSEKLGYSRMPVREALQILEEQGLVRRLATRHVVVADFSERNIEEIFDMAANMQLGLLLKEMLLLYIILLVIYTGIGIVYYSWQYQSSSKQVKKYYRILRHIDQCGEKNVRTQEDKR